VGYTRLQMKRFPRVLPHAIWFFGGVVAFVAANGKNPEPKPFFRQDLKEFGFPMTRDGRIIVNYSDVNFLSDDLILVSVNSRVFGPVEKANSDQPISKLLLFDLTQNALAKSAEVPVEKRGGSVKATHGGNFVLLNESGIHLCSLDLHCGLSHATTGPLFISPKGSRLVVGGNGKTEQRVLDADSLEQLDHYAWGQAEVVPGDNGRLLIRRNGKLYIRLPDAPEQLLPLNGGGIWPDARFVNDTVMADFESDTILAVTKTDGTVLFRIPVKARWHVSELTTTASGSRFCFHEAGYTTFNSIVNFLDIDSGRPFNFETATVISTESGSPLLQLHWDPRPYVGPLSSPALSPDGHKLAILHGGFLEVYSVP